MLLHVKLWSTIKNFCKNVSVAHFPNAKFVEDIVEELYMYLDKFILNEGLLSGILIAFLHDINEFVTQHQVVMRLELNIQPYLYDGPVKLGCFFHIFVKLGASEQLTGFVCQSP